MLFSKCDGYFCSILFHIFFIMTTFKIRPEAPKIYSEEFIIRSYHVDIHQKLTLPKLCSFFQEIAGNHTVACGVGWEVLQQANMFWVLSRLKIQISEFPAWQDKITIETWSNGLNGLMAIRHFNVLNHNGESIIKAISSWLTVNTETRRLVRADDYMRDFPLNQQWLFEHAPDKITALANPIKFAPANVLFTETDMNEHMNNVSYIDRIINAYGFEFLLAHKIIHFEINFLKEAVPDDTLQVAMQKDDEYVYRNSIIRISDKQDMVRTHIEWEKK